MAFFVNLYIYNMKDDVLDAIENEQKKTFNYKHFIVPLLIGLLLFWSVYIRFTSGYVLLLIDWVAYVAVLATIFLNFLNERLYVYGLATVLFFGTLNFYGFTPIQFSVKVFFIPFQPVSAALMIIHLALFKEYMGKPEVTLSKQNEIFDSKVKSFKLKFESRTKEELLAIVNTSGYRKEAKQAAQELLLEKYPNNSQESN